MMQDAFFCTVGELAAMGRENIPPQFISGAHLIYSSPATLAFNSPGAEGFGVKRAGLAIPDSIMLIVAPGCCGRNTSLISSMREYDNRFFYLMMDETGTLSARVVDYDTGLDVECPDIQMNLSDDAITRMRKQLEEEQRAQRESDEVITQMNNFQKILSERMAKESDPAKIKLYNDAFLQATTVSSMAELQNLRNLCGM